MTNLTLKQAAILVYIKEFARSRGFPPTVREIGDQFKIAPSSVFDHLKALERKSFIRRLPFKPRCLEILREKP